MFFKTEMGKKTDLQAVNQIMKLLIMEANLGEEEVGIFQ